MVKYFTDLVTGGARGGMSDAEMEQGFERINNADDPWLSLMDQGIIAGETPKGMQQYRMRLDTER